MFGLGYSGTAIALAALAEGFAVTATMRNAARSGRSADDGIVRVGFSAADAAVASATHVLSTVPPDVSGDPVLSRYGDVITAAGGLRWIGYLSTTGVYGDRGGAWVDEFAEPAPASDRSRRRLAAEQGWRRFAERYAVDVFRLGGIYGPGRSVLDDVRAGTARRVIKPGHTFGRIHRADIALAVLAAMRQERGPGVRVLHLVDDEPAESADVVVEAARLLAVAPPPGVPFDEAVAGMSPMARSFWNENRNVSNERTQQALGVRWRFPNYREGLRAILAEERGEGAG